MPVDFRKKLFEFEDMGGKHQAMRVGKCAHCGSNVYRVRDWHTDTKTWGGWYDPDPRGYIHQNAACSTFIAEEYGMVGPDVLACFECYNTQYPNERIVQHAKTEVWSQS